MAKDPKDVNPYEVQRPRKKYKRKPNPKDVNPYDTKAYKRTKS